MNPLTSSALYRSVIATAGGLEVQAQNKDTMAVAMYTSPPYDLAVPAMAVSRLSINLTESVVSGQVEGERLRRFETRCHSVFFTPAGAAAHWRKERPSRHINIYFDRDAFREAEGLDLPPTPLLNGALPSAKLLVERLVDEMVQSRPFAIEAIDSLARLILVQLARRQLSAGDEGLPAAVRERVDSFIQAHLDRRLLVSELAQVAGLTPARFTQAFACATGKAPHQYVLDRRVQRAADLLRGTHLPLAEVAASCGFSSQQHMARLLKQRLRLTAVGVRKTPTT